MICPHDGHECVIQACGRYPCPAPPAPPRMTFWRFILIMIMLFVAFLAAMTIGVDHHGPCINTITNTPCH